MGEIDQQQVGGDHYRKHKITPWDIVDAYDLDFYRGNAVKYLLRDKSDRLEDLRKARHYIDKAIARERGRRHCHQGMTMHITGTCFALDARDAAIIRADLKRLHGITSRQPHRRHPAAARRGPDRRPDQRRTG